MLQVLKGGENMRYYKIYKIDFDLFNIEITHNNQTTSIDHLTYEKLKAVEDFLIKLHFEDMTD